jgi:hypothetical protein
MLRCRKLPIAHLSRVRGDCLVGITPEFCVALNEHRTKTRESSKDVIRDQNLAAARTRCADPYSWNRDLSRDYASYRFGDLFKDDSKGSSLRDSRRISHDPLAVSASTLHLITAERIHALRSETDMSHHRNTPRD